MKKLFTILAVAIALMVSSANVNAKTFSFGVKAGANFNKLSFNKEILNDINSANSSGWEAGLMVEANLPIVGGLGADLSLMYARMNNSGGELGDNAGKNFIMLPLNVKYKFSLPVVGNYLAPYVFTGPNFMFKLDKNILQNMQTKTCQVAWNIGLGLEFFHHLQVGASYNFGINKVANFTLGTNQDFDIKNNYWMVTAAYLF